MSFRFRDYPLSTETYKRRGITLAPIMTKCFDETIDGQDTHQITQMSFSPRAWRDRSRLIPIRRLFSRWSSSEKDSSSNEERTHASLEAAKGEGRIETNPPYEEISRWSSTTEDSCSQYSEPEIDTESYNQELYEETLAWYRQFFDNRPLMRCLDTNEDEILADLLFERLLREVRQLAQPLKNPTQSSRGEVQARAFWENVRMELEIDESLLGKEWPEGYPELFDGFKVYISDRGWRNTLREC